MKIFRESKLNENRWRRLTEAAKKTHKMAKKVLEREIKNIFKYTLLYLCAKYVYSKFKKNRSVAKKTKILIATIHTLLKSTSLIGTPKKNVRRTFAFVYLLRTFEMRWLHTIGGKGQNPQLWKKVLYYPNNMGQSAFDNELEND